MELLGYSAALIIGIVLGIIGGGGSILTVPVFVYLLGLNPTTATAYSLFVVGTTSLFGSIKNLKTKDIAIKTALVFALPSIVTVYLTRKYLIYNLPAILYHNNEIVISKDLTLMVLFSLIMLMTSYSMIKKDFCKLCGSSSKKFNYPLIILEGIIVGVLTGIVGAGGGFLIIPALVIFAKLPIKKAIATSLIIIAFKSLLGFIGDIENIVIDWNILLPFSALSIIGIFIGIQLNKYTNDEKLKLVFGWFVLVMGAFILTKEVLF